MSLALNDPAPDFDLLGVDGSRRSLESYADASILVVIQSCNHCPYVLAWEGRMNALQPDYGDRGVRVVAINSNDASRYPEDSFEKMVERADREQFTFDYLHDPDQTVARALGSERTPEAFVFDGSRTLVYHGAIDDNRDEAAVTRKYLREALDAILGGNIPPLAATPSVGCTVKWLE